jgi:hypothetical protein
MGGLKIKGLWAAALLAHWINLPQPGSLDSNWQGIIIQSDSDYTNGGTS